MHRSADSALYNRTAHSHSGLQPPGQSTRGTRKSSHPNDGSALKRSCCPPMRAPEDAAPVPELGAAARLVRILVAAIVVLASAATGYVGSRIWPLPTNSDPTMILTAADNNSTEPELREGAPLHPSQESKSAAATEPSAQVDNPSRSGVAGAARVRETARFEVEGSSTASPDAPVTVPYRTPAEQAHAEGRRAPATSTGAGRNERATAPRRWAPDAKTPRAARGQSTKEAGPALVQFAPNPKPNQASRDFMARPSSY